MTKDKAQRVAEVNVVKGQIMDTTVVRDANKVIVPQYFDSDLGVFVPITQNWGGNTGGGGSTSEIEKEIQQLKNAKRKGYKLILEKEKSNSINISEDLVLEFSYKEFTQSTTSDPPESRQAEGFVIVLGNASEDKTHNVYATIDVSGYRSEYYPSGGWYQWTFGELEPNHAYELLEDSPASFGGDSVSKLIITDDTTNEIFDIGISGYSTDEDKYCVAITVDVTKQTVVR